MLPLFIVHEIRHILNKNNFSKSEYVVIKKWTTTEKGERIMTIPTWVFAVVVGIVISALMAIKTGRDERQLEKEHIEREGDIYIKRLEEEKERRQTAKSTGV